MSELDLTDVAILYKINKINEQIDKISLDCRLEGDQRKQNILNEEIKRLQTQKSTIIKGVIRTYVGFAILSLVGFALLFLFTVR